MKRVCLYEIKKTSVGMDAATVILDLIDNYSSVNKIAKTIRINIVTNFINGSYYYVSFCHQSEINSL